jgi:hypothetical protein
MAKAFAVALGLSLASYASAQLDPNFPVYKSKNAAPIAGIKVGLAAQNNATVWDTDLAMWTNPLMVNQVKTTFAFGQCFGGGMIEDLRNNAAAANSDFSGTSAAQWNEFAFYPRPGGTDWVDQYTIAAAPAPRADTIASNAWLNDPFGTAPGNLGWEHAQWQSVGAGNAVKLNDAAANNRYAILWSGDPNNTDWNQLSAMYNQLTVGYGYNANNIHILAGAGAADPLLPPALALAPNLRSATPNNLQMTLGGMNNLGAMDQLFFLANDHGVININGVTHRQPKRDGYNMPDNDPIWGHIPQSWVPAPGTTAFLIMSAGLATRRRRAAH